jgi:hypothetical protein
MFHTLPSVVIYKAMIGPGALASDTVREHNETLEAEFRVAVPAKHFVALGILCGLIAEI